MWNLNYDSPKEIMSILDREGLAMTKKFGQNFLINKTARENIAALIAAEEGECLWEIGPGLGAITALTLKSNATVKAFEIDNGFCRVLKESAFSDEKNFTLVQGDALKTLFSQKERPDIIYGNLPYNVGSICIAKLIEEGITPKRMVFTLQKEVVERMCALPGDEAYSSFSILTQLDYQNTLTNVISKGCFYPEPQVESAVVLMTKREEPLVPDSLRPIFLPLIRDLFAQRRKNIRNNLLSGFVGKNGGKEAVAAVLELSGFSGSERAETFGFPELIKITRAVAAL